jgi:hypothetical protein
MKNRELLFSWFWGMVLMAMPLFLRIQTGGYPIYSKNWLFMVASFISIILFGVRLNSTRSYCFAALIGIAAFGLKEISAVSCIMQLLFLSCGCLMFVQFEENLKSKESQKIMMNFAFATSIIFSLWAFQEKYTSFNLYTVMYGLKALQDGGIAGPLANPGYSAGFLAISLPLYFDRKRIFLAWLPISAMMIYGGTTVWIAIFTGIFCLFLFNWKRIYAWICGISAAILSTVVVTLNFIDMGGSDRYIVFKHILGMFIDIKSILFGHGLGYLAPYMRKAKITDPIFAQMHNDWLEALFAFGIIGIIPISIIFLTLCRDVRNKIAFCGMIIAMVWATTWFPFHLSPLFILILMWYAISLNDNHGGTNGTCNCKKSR